MFKSISMLESKAKRLLVSYEDFVASTSFTLSCPGEVVALQVSGMKNTIDGFGILAEEVIGDPDFPSLSADLKGDLRNISEACSGAAQHIATATHPNEIWTKMDDLAKHDAVARQLVSKDDRNVVVAHLSFSIINQKAIPAPPVLHVPPTDPLKP